MRAAAFLCVLLLAVFLVASPVYAAEDGFSFSGLWDGFASLLSEIGNFFGNLLTGIIEGLKFLFIPGDGYFPRIQAQLQERLSEKFGGVKLLFTYFRDRFGNLSRYRGTDGMFVLQFPDSHFFSGWRIDILGNARGLVSFIRNVLTGMVTLMTAAFVYHKVREFINT